MNATHTPKALLLSGLLLLANTDYARTGPPPPPIGGGHGNPPCWPPPCVPIDSGLVFLIAAAALYGGYMLYRAQKKQKSQA
ncbi:MAG: hypothetical protein JST67_05170 [Bacteroidetes bacterium]|nr:hypothetical protein [Bacteroidota bacterium]